MSKQLKESATPVLLNNLVVKTKRLDSSGSTRSIGSPIDTFLETQKIFLKNQNGSTKNTPDNNKNDVSYSDIEDDVEEGTNHLFNRLTEIEPRVSISESCIESDSDSEDFEQSNTSVANFNNGYNTHSPMSMVFDTKSNSNLHLVTDQSHCNSQRNSIYKNTFTTSSSSLDNAEEKLKNDDFDQAIEEDEYDEDAEGRLPSAGNYLAGIKGSGSTVARTSSISQSTRPKVDNIEQAIIARASPIHKYNSRSKSFNSGLVQKQRRSSSGSSNLEKKHPNQSHALLMKDNHPFFKSELEESGNLITKINSSTHKSTDHTDKKSHLRNQVYPSKSSNSSVPTLPSYHQQTSNTTNWRTDKDGVPLLLESSQTNAFFEQFCHKFQGYMEMESIASLKQDHEKRVCADNEFNKDEYIKFMEYPTEDLLEMMSSLLTKIIHTNDNLGAENKIDVSIKPSSRNIDPTLLFRGQNIPKLPINKYLQRAHHYCATSNDVYLSLLVYFDRLSQPDRDPETNEQIGLPKLILDSYNIHRLIITAFTVATKFSQDIYFTNKRYAKVGGISDNELNKLELVFLDLLSWERLSCSGPELLRYWNLLHNFWKRESVSLT